MPPSTRLVPPLAPAVHATKTALTIGESRCGARYQNTGHTATERENQNIDIAVRMQWQATSHLPLGVATSAHLVLKSFLSFLGPDPSSSTASKASSLLTDRSLSSPPGPANMRGGEPPLLDVRPPASVCWDGKPARVVDSACQVTRSIPRLITGSEVRKGKRRASTTWHARVRRQKQPQKTPAAHRGGGYDTWQGSLLSHLLIKITMNLTLAHCHNPARGHQDKTRQIQRPKKYKQILKAPINIIACLTPPSQD